VDTRIQTCICAECEFRDVAFSSLDENYIRELCNNKEEVHYSRGEVINNQGDPITHFKYLKHGLVKLFRITDDGEQQIITITRPFEFVSTMSVFSGEKYKYSVAALEDSVICSVRIDFIRDLFMKNSSFAINLFARVSKISEKIIVQTLDIRQKNLAGRVAFVLLYLMNDIFKSRVFDIPVSRKEIADYIGMSTANVIRTLSDFKRDAIIRTTGKTIEILDIDKLEIISKRG